MLANIIDRRKHRHRWRKVNAIIEPTRHDNSVKNSDRAQPHSGMDKLWIGYDEIEHISVQGAVEWATSHQDAVTLYLYDKDDGIYEVKRASRKGSGGGKLTPLGQPSRPGRRSQKSARSSRG